MSSKVIWSLVFLIVSIISASAILLVRSETERIDRIILESESIGVVVGE